MNKELTASEAIADNLCDVCRVDSAVFVINREGHTLLSCKKEYCLDKVEELILSLCALDRNF